MKDHRVRTCPSIDDNPKPHLFIELEEDSWLEVKKRPPHDAIHNFLDQEKKTNARMIKLDTRYFRLFTRDWTEEKAIS